jgi:hypothetical protein
MSAAPPPLKILVIGPSRAGKSGAASFLAGAHASPLYAPGPTAGVRVLAFERGGHAVELWDVSGDQGFESAWPAVQKDAEAWLLMWNADAAGAAREAELWVQWFRPRAGLAAACCLTSAPGAASVPGAPNQNPAELPMPSPPQPGAPGHGALVGAPEVLHVDTCGDGLKRALDVLIRAAVRARARAAAAGGDGKRGELE